MFRFREYRKDQETRDNYAEVRLSANDFIYPYFVVEGENIMEEIPGIRGMYKFSIDQLIENMEHTVSLGIRDVLLFGLIENSQKDNTASAALAENSLIVRAIKAVKQSFSSIRIYADVCICEYMSHGHCGVVSKGKIDNDATLPILAQIATSYALAGADFVAPSAMMDGQVEAIRQNLNKNGKYSTKIFSFAVKYASNFYLPFRNATQITSSQGDRKSYQLDYRTTDQSIGEAWMDKYEGADWVVIQPAHTYLDVIARIKTSFPNINVAAYHTSGEYMSIVAAAQAGILDEYQAFSEILTAIKRAGASKIVSYYAKNYLQHQYKNSELYEYYI